ncbi:flavoprotein [Nocardiopsis rhodophaea]|uniref:Flavoprotein n=1 Tax=Nocardiopsis rhodophaea TaxID=280238 RepID=A0ABN2TB54_9ACTN
MTEADAPPASQQAPPEFGAQRLLLVGTGALVVSSLPFWLNWLRITYPALKLRLVITRSAERFVSREALTAISGRTVQLDTWPDEPTPSARHVELAEWAEAIAIYPATLHFVSRFALGLADTPTLLALQCTQVPIGLAPALPPNAERFSNYRSHVAMLQEHPNVVVLPPHATRSATTRRVEESVAPAPLSELLQHIERLRQAPGEPVEKP